MGVFSFIIFLLIALLIIIIVGSVQNFCLWCVTKENNEFVVMILPALLSILLLCGLVVGTFYVLKLFDIDAIKIICSMIMNWEYNFNSYIYIIIAYILCSILFVILQAFCLKLVNLDYKKIFSFMCKKEKPKLLNGDNTQDTSLIPIPKHDTTSFFSLFAASIFSFAICFFSSFLLLYIGTLIGTNYISK